MGTGSNVDPFFRQELREDLEIVIAARPIRIAIGSKEPGIVNVAGDRDLVVLGDEVTVVGTLSLQHAADTTLNGANGRNVTVLVRQLGAEDATIDTSGAAGQTSNTVTVTDPRNGKPGTPGKDVWQPGQTKDWGQAVLGSTFFLSSNEWPCNPPAEDGESAGMHDPKQPDPGPPPATIGAFVTWCQKVQAAQVNNPASTLNGKKGDDGGAGGNGGTIDLRAGHLADGTALTLASNGGQGGNGVQGQPGATGGKGGAGHYYTTAPTAPGMGDWYAPASGGAGGRGGDGGDGGNGGDGGHVGQVSVSILQAGATGISVARSPGQGGECGGGVNHDKLAPGGGGGQSGWCPRPSGDGYGMPDRPGLGGAKGGPGKPGTTDDPKAIPAFTPDTQCQPKDLVQGIPTSLLGYLSMQVDRLRSDVLAAGVTGPQGSDDSPLADRIDWLSTLLSAYSPKAGEFDAFDALRGDAETLASNYRKGLDYFGNAPSYAPLGSIAFHRDQFEQTVGRLQQAQAHLDELGDSVNTGAATTAALANARTRLESEAAFLDGKIDEAAQAMSSLVDRLNTSDDSVIEAKEKVVAQDTASFSDAISQAMGLSLDNFIDAFGQFAFVGEEGPAAIMAISQVGKLIADGTSNVLADDGQSIPKQFLLEQLSDATTDQEFSQQLTDRSPNTALVRAVAQQKQVDGICDKFLSYPSARDLRAAFEDYVAAVQARNNDILVLNQTATARQQLLVKRARLKAASATDAASLAALSDPGAATMGAQLARIVTQYKEECVRQLYLASRAYWFWSLKARDVLSSALDKLTIDSCVPLTTDVLSSISLDIYQAMNNDIEQRLADPAQWFPPADANQDARGLRMDFGADSEVVKKLRAGKSASFSIPAARPTPHADAANPFLGLGDVRLSKVRPWVFGATTTNQMLRVDIEHGSADTIIDPAGACTVVSHDPLGLTFRFDMSKGVDTPQSIYDGANGPIDGDVRSPEQDPMSALIGPFTTWKVTISPDYNPGLQTSDITRLSVEFFGHQRRFPPSATTAAGA